MTLLYRSPNLIIDGVAWHVTVQERPKSGRRIMQYRWRHANRGWRAIHEWPGKLPKGLGRFFQPYRRSINVALIVEESRRAA